MPTSVLLTERYHPFLLEALRRRPDLRVLHLPGPDFSGLSEALSEAHLWVLRGAIPVDEALLSQAPRLQALIRAGSGIEHIQVQALKKRGLLLYTTPHANAAPVAEYVATAVMLLTRQFLPAHHALREQDQWNRHTFIGREIASLNVAIIGFGHNGSRTAHLLKQLGARVLAYDKYKAGFGAQGIEEAPLEALWLQADVVSLHVPLTAETQGWVDEAFLDRFHKPIALINAARGGIVSLPAVAQALEKGKLWGLALDTLPQEPPEKLSHADRQAWTYLRRHPAVLLTPHIAGLTEESELRLAQSVLAILRALLERDTQSQSYPVQPI